MMLNLSRKLYISLITVFLLVAVAATATLAWFELNTNAWMDDMELNVSSGKGIQISINGTQFRSNLSQAEIKRAVIAKANGYKINSNYDYVTETGIVISSSNYEQEYNDLINFYPVTSFDGKNFFERGDDIPLDLKKGMYLSFDIYFKTANEYAKVYFSGEEQTLSTGEKIPKSEFITDETNGEIGFPTHLNNKFTTYDLLNGSPVEYDNSKSYSAQSQRINNFRVYASDALRFSCTTTINNVNQNDTKIYEPNIGNGSYATTISDEYYVTSANTIMASAYDSDKNAGFTYYNNVRGSLNGDTGEGEVETLSPIVYSEKPRTYKDFFQCEAAEILTLDATNNYGANGSAMATISMWIEGWDADCFDAIFSQSIISRFSFTTYAPSEYNDTRITAKILDPDNGVNMHEDWYNIVTGKVITPLDPVIDTYSTGTKKKFAYWALESNRTKPFDFSKPINESVTLVTIWQ